MPKNFWKKLKNPTHGQAILALAPMAGFTDSAFRTICKKFGADVVYSEMASAAALTHKPEKTLELLHFTEKERPYVVQLFGSNPEHFAFAAKLLSRGIKSSSAKATADKPDGIDINFGCPAPKVFKTGAGCALMKNKKLAREIIAAVCENTTLPVSIKIRAGLGKSSAIDFIKYIKDLPFSAVMVHGRTYAEGFSGAVDFALIEKIKKIIPEKIVLANGGINTAEEAVKILQEYPTLDGLGLARGALGRPFIFEEIKDSLGCHSEFISRSRFRVKPGMTITKSEMTNIKAGMKNTYDFELIKKIILRHAKLVWQEKKEPGILELRKHLGWYVKGFPGASEMRQKLVQVKTLTDIKKVLSNLRLTHSP